VRHYLPVIQNERPKLNVGVPDKKEYRIEVKALYTRPD
jgi:hypothetical protein